MINIRIRPLPTKMLLYIVVLLSLCIVEVKSKLCRNYFTGDIFYCPHYQSCCRDHCCTAPLSFYNLWYFWLFLLMLLLMCSGGGYWYKRKYQPIMRGPYMASTGGTGILFGGRNQPPSNNPHQPYAGRPFGQGNTTYYAPGPQGPPYQMGAPNNLNKPPYYYYPQDTSFFPGQPHMAPPPSYQDLYQPPGNTFPNPSIPVPMPGPTPSGPINSGPISNTATNTVFAQR